MKAIIISDSDARALLDKLELVKMKGVNWRGKTTTENQLFEDVHGAFHYVVTHWLQEQGADLTKR